MCLLEIFLLDSVIEEAVIVLMVVDSATIDVNSVMICEVQSY